MQSDNQFQGDDRVEGQQSKTRSRLATLSSTSLFFRKQLWLWPLLAALAMAGVGWWLRQSVEATLEQSLASQLQAILQADVTALDSWFASQEATVSSIVGDPEIRSYVRSVARAAQGVPNDELRVSLDAPIKDLRAQLKSTLEAHHYSGFVVADLEQRILVSAHDEQIGENLSANSQMYYRPSIAGKATVTRPFPSRVALPDA